MGYMGLGLQKWIFTMKSRKPLSTHKKTTFDKVSQCKRNFKLQPTPKSFKEYYIIIMLMVLISLFVFKIYPRLMVYFKNHNQSLLEFKKSKNDNAFNFLIASGKKRLGNNNIIGAYSEFKLAKAIFPNNLEVNILLKESLIDLCVSSNLYCDELDSLNVN